MPRTNSVALQVHKALSATTLCYLTRIGPLPITGAYIGLTSHSKDIFYDDGDVAMWYYARTGTESAVMSSANDLSVDNSEAESLIELPSYPNTGITQEMVDTNALDGVRYVIYEVNWRDLTMGHEIQTAGPIGEVRQMQNTGSVTFELRTWSQYLKQTSVVELDSLTCRVKRFGSVDGEERYPCKYAGIAGEWITPLTVTSVGAEVIREFTVSSLAQADDYFAPGLWKWLTGDNAGTHQEVGEFSAGGIIALRFAAKKAIQVGDTGEIRRDCTRRWSGHNSCETYSNRPFFRGEPFIPVSDSVALTVPGAGI